MQIRKAEREELAVCAAMDASYVTEQVWQLLEQPRREETTLTLRIARLPRSLRVPYPYDLAELEADWEKGAYLLVAEEEGEIRGFADLQATDRPQIVWLKHLVVAEPFRRQRIGSRLLQAGIAWAAQQGFLVLMADCQTKNFPATSLYRKNGLRLCGYNDMYYPNGDIALFFGIALSR